MAANTGIVANIENLLLYSHLVTKWFYCLLGHLLKPIDMVVSIKL